MVWQPGTCDSLSATGLASLSSIQEFRDWSCVRSEYLTPSLLGRLLRPLYTSRSRGTPMQNPPGGGAEFPSSQPCWGLCSVCAVEGGLEQWGNHRAPQRASDRGPRGPCEEGRSHPQKGGHSTHSPEGPRRGRSADMAISSGYRRGHHRSQHP